ncbi:MAG: hypothetical protein ACTSYG_08575 [Candidatus Heimdallarchaeota archaeon]
MEDEEIKKMLDENIEYWKGEIGDVLIGKLKEIRTGIGKYDSKMYLFEKDDKLIGVWGNTVLDNHIDSSDVGKKIGIKRIPTPEGKTYKNYNIIKSPDGEE